MTVRWCTEVAEEASWWLRGVEAVLRTRCKAGGTVPTMSPMMVDKVVGLTGKAVSAQWLDSVPA